MFHSLKYDVTFPPNDRFPMGQHLSQDLGLKSGFWAIVGANETGKSMILEMLKFSLFGTAALRGRVDDYKTLKVTTSFEIRGVGYTVDRTMKTAFLKRGVETVASGVTAVNQKIVETLGFGMAIFEMANCINQGEVERLGAMLPSERKKMIDGVLGIDALEVVAKWGMDEARINDREAEAVRRRLVCPTQPESYENYVPSGQIDISGLRAEATELAQIEGFLSVSRDKPHQPTCSVDLPAENMKIFSAKRAELRETVARLNAEIAVLPTTAIYNPAQLDDAEAEWGRFDRYTEAQRWLTANPEPTDDEADLTRWMAEWAAVKEWEAYRATRLELLGLRCTIKDAAHVDCPACDHHFPLDADRIAQYEARAAELELIPEPTSVHPEQRPGHTVAECERRWQVLLAYDHATYRAMTGVEALDQPSIPRAQILVLRAQFEQVAQRTAKVSELGPLQTKLTAMPDYEQMLVERLAYEAALPVYREQLTAFEAWVSERVLKQARATALQGVRERLSLAEASHAAALVYEAALARFGADYDVYVAGVEDAERLEAAAVAHRQVRDAMAILRSLIKQHLMPSLNRVSSVLLGQMTGGQRGTIAVDEDFNVIVDGQDLDTLSGSGKACANLAIRIALGRVLTNRVFSVLLADEIDASMDDFRAGETSNVLCNLGNSVLQVLQVSHKHMESVNQIDLGDPIGSRSD